MESKNKRDRILVIRWSLYILVLLLAAALQSTPGFFSWGEWKAFWILGVCVAVSVQENEFSGALFSVLGGMLWDLTAGRTVGSFTLMLLFVGFFCSVLVQLYLKRAYINIFLLNVGAGLVVVSLDFLFGYLMTGYPNPLQRYVQILMPEVVVSAVLALVTMRIIHSIATRYSLP